MRRVTFPALSAVALARSKPSRATRRSRSALGH